MERITGLIMIKYFFDVLLRTNNAFCLAKYDPRGLLSAAFSKCLSSAFFTDVLFTYHFPRLSLRHHIASPLCWIICSLNLWIYFIVSLYYFTYHLKVNLKIFSFDLCKIDNIVWYRRYSTWRTNFENQRRGVYVWFCF